MDAASLAAALLCAQSKAEEFLPYFELCFTTYDISSVARQAAFLAQVGHESGGLKWLREIWGPTAAQRGYEGRADLGNTQPGDGKRYMGRGVIQVTGRSNYAQTRDALRVFFADVPDFETDPAQLEQPRWAVLSAGAYWASRKLNAVADSGDFTLLTKKINGGLNGFADRQSRLKAATEALGAVVPETKPVPPFLLAALPSLIQAAPSLIRIFGDSPQAEKNAKAAEVVADIAQKVTNQPTVQGAVEAIAADPAKAADYREAVHLSMNDLLALTQQINDMDQKNIVAARTYNDGEPWFLETPWVKLKFIHLLSLIFVGFSGYFVQKYWMDLTPELKGAVITLMIIAGWNGVRDYWMGSSSGSDRKTSEIIRATKDK